MPRSSLRSIAISQLNVSFMEAKNHRSRGRPEMSEGKKSRKVDLRLTENEYESLLALEKSLGISKTEIIRLRVLKENSVLLLNAKELIVRLDALGSELGRSGNNINQLARYANVMNKRGSLSGQVAERFNVLLAGYIKSQLSLEVTMRKIIRMMSR